MALAFTLPDTSGSSVALHEDGAAAAVVVFTCNHCPYALAWHDRVLAVARDYPDVKVLAVSSNDAERYPRDSFDAMRERVAADGGWPIPYLYDESQEVARAYDAKTTPAPRKPVARSKAGLELDSNDFAPAAKDRK